MNARGAHAETIAAYESGAVSHTEANTVEYLKALVKEDRVAGSALARAVHKGSGGTAPVVAAEEAAEEEVSVAWYLVAWFALISVLVFFVCVPPLGLLYVATEMGNAKTLVWIWQCFVGMMLFYWVVLPSEIAFFLLFIQLFFTVTLWII